MEGGHLHVNRPFYHLETAIEYIEPLLLWYFVYYLKIKVEARFSLIICNTRLYSFGIFSSPHKQSQKELFISVEAEFCGMDIHLKKQAAHWNIKKKTRGPVKKKR